MEITIKLVTVAVIGSIGVLLLKKENPSMGALLTVAVCGAAFVLALKTVQAVSDFLEEINTLCHLAPETVTAVFKAVGIALLTHLSAALCRDFGQQAAGSVVEIGGAAAILIAAAPMIRNVLQLIENWLIL